ncbi:MAG: thiamine phosphate synthase, partial [Peptoniphilaceae bacterium]|nr:thiamine phosphate synthase [Peptoniphilaceae bacterium]
NVPLFINDNVNVAMKVHADGIHVGQDDMDVKKVRNIVGNSMYIGVSAHNIEEAINAEIEGADYIGVGTIFSTSTKLDAEIVSIEMLSEICKSVKIPVVAIGGLNENNILKLSKTGIDGVAIVSNIFSSDNIKEKCERLCEIIKSIVRN